MWTVGTPAVRTPRRALPGTPPALGGERPVHRPNGVRDAQREQLRFSVHSPEDHPRSIGEVDFRLRAGRVGLRHETRGQLPLGFVRDLRTPAGDVVPRRRIRHLAGLVLIDQANSKPRWATVLSNTRTPTSTSPSQDSVMCSAPGARRVQGRPRPLRQREVSKVLRRQVTPDGCLRPQTRRARRHVCNRRRYDAIDQWAFCSLSAPSRRPGLLRPTPRRRRPAPPSATRPRQPTRRHPPRLPAPPHPLHEHTAWAHTEAKINTRQLDTLRTWYV
jgi:hypothetical protein